MQKTVHLPNDAEEYPGIDIAYPLAVEAYNISINRLEAQENRLQSLTAFVATVTIAIPTIASQFGINFFSPWFWISCVMAVIAIGSGIFGSLYGNIIVIGPDNLFKGWLHKPEWEFKKDFIYFSGEHNRHNRHIAFIKWLCNVAISIFLALQIISLLVWVITTS